MTLSPLGTQSEVRTAGAGGAGGLLPLPPLIARLGLALEADGLSYCQWKGHSKRARWATGEGDLDLLVDRTAAAQFEAVLNQLGFKLALSAREQLVPGVLSFLGPDPTLGRLIHVHVHYQLVIGDSWTRHYRLPIERAVLDSAIQRVPFKTPVAEFELLLFVLRMALRHQPRDLLRTGEPPWLPTIRLELERLEREADHSALIRALTELLPDVGLACFARCLESLRLGSSPWSRLGARYGLERRLRPYGHRPTTGVLARRVATRIRSTLGRHAKRRPQSSKTLASGGSVIALVGADGAGKSTCARALEAWLGAEIRTRRVHMGLPDRSLLTLFIGGLLKIGRLVDDRPGFERYATVTDHLELARCVCTARDRHRLYREVRSLAASGGLAICERYPIPENYAIAGPSIVQGVATAARGRLATLMRRWEGRYYARITEPDLVVVLRVEPEIAVQRKTDEPAAYVRHRARLVWDIDWSNRPARVVDAGRPLGEVLATLRARIWETL